MTWTTRVSVEFCRQDDVYLEVSSELGVIVMIQSMGELKTLNIRDVFSGEASEFTPWLAENGLETLAETLGMQLEYVDREVNVGPFRADIQALDADGNAVVIENQFNQTDHDHLGKMLTYVAGLEDVRTAVWITETVREEHRAVIDWLNNHTDEGVNFFLVKVKVVQIGDSKPAPLFQVEAKPNQWTKQTKKQADAEKAELTDTKLANLHFFETLVDRGAKAPWSWRTPRAQHWFDIAIGTASAHLSITLRKGKALDNSNDVQIEYYIGDDKALFDSMAQHKDEIENKLGPLEWMRLDDKKASRIVKNLQINWLGTDTEAQADAVIAELIPFYEVFGKLTKQIV